MTWNQLKIHANASNAELISDALLSLDAVSVSFLDAEDQPLFEPAPGETPLWDKIIISSLFSQQVTIKQVISEIEKNLKLTLNYQCTPLQEKNWQYAWLEHCKPLLFGKSLWITVEEQQHLISDKNAVKVILNPGLAFGTGSHPTTALCLEWLAENVHPGQHIIDYGCGSGILGIAAAKLGAKQVLAIDNDPQAITATLSNALNNQIPDTQLQAILPQQTIEPADILVANILLKPLIELAPTFASLVKHNGHIVLSGILSEQTDQILAAYQPWFNLQPPQQKEDWMCVSGYKRA